MNEMRIYKLGEKSKGLCETCGKVVPTTFALREVYLEETGATVPDVLVAVCDSCGQTVSIPHQSTPRLAAARRAKTRKLEARIPRHLDDALRLVAQELDTPCEVFSPLLFQYYFEKVASSRTVANWVGGLAAAETVRGIKDCRLSLRLSDSQWETATRALARTGLQGRSALVQALILAAVQDVFERRSARRRRDLEHIAGLVR
jgi:hypothetical protein